MVKRSKDSQRAQWQDLLLVLRKELRWLPTGSCTWEAGGESAGKSNRRKTEGPLLNQPTHCKGLLYLLWLALTLRLLGEEKRREEKGGEGRRGEEGRKDAQETWLVLMKASPLSLPAVSVEDNMVPGRKWSEWEPESFSFFFLFLF